MPKIQIEGVEYETTNLSEPAKQILSQVQKITARIQETQNMSAILTKAKRAYIAELKTEMLSAKAGLLIDNDN